MMDSRGIKQIFERFVVSGTFVSATPYKPNSIYESYIITTDEDTGYILRRVNHHLFAKPEESVKNREQVVGHIRNKLIKQRVHDISRKYITYFYTNRYNSFYRDYDGNYWTLSLIIKESKSYSYTLDDTIAYELGSALGEFQNRIEDFDPKLLKESIPLFQNVPYWQEQLAIAISKANPERFEASKGVINSLREIEMEAHLFQQLCDDEVLPIRVVHNNMQLSSVLFDLNKKPLCIVNLELVMPGILPYDFGDMACSVCSSISSTFKEISFNMRHFKVFVSGYMEKAKHLLTYKERWALPLSCKIMPWLQAHRYIVDYLNGDKIYFVEQADENLLRAQKMSYLMQKVSENYSEITRICND